MAIRTWQGGGDSANPNDWSVAANWKEAAVPVNADEVFVRDSAVDILAGLDQSAVVLDNLNIEQSFTGLLGTATEFLQIASTDVVIGEVKSTQTLSGSRRLNLDFKAGTNRIEIQNSANTPQDQGKAPIRLLVLEAACDIFILGGFVNIADEADQTSTIGDISVSDPQAKVMVGSGVTFDNFFQFSGLGRLFSMPGTKVECDAGTVILFGTDTLVLADIGQNGTVQNNLSGNLTTAIIFGFLDYSGSNFITTLATANLKIGGRIRADFSRLTITTQANEDSRETTLALG